MSKVVCKICGNSYDRLSNHLRLTHKISKYDYLEMYPNSELVSEELHNRQSNATSNQWKTNPEFVKAVISGVRKANERDKDKLVQRMIDLNERQKIDKEFSEYCSSQRSKGQVNSWKKDWVRDSRISGMKKAFDKPGYTNSQWDKIRDIDNYQPYKKGYINGVYYKSSYEKYFLEFLFSNNIKFEYEPTYFYYIDSKGKKRKYYPDYYLNDYDLYIEIHPKNLLYESFMNKISVVPNLLLLTEDELFSDDLLNIIINANTKMDNQQPRS